MAGPLSDDIRQRLVAVVEGGMSRRSAAKHFGVAASMAIQRVDQWWRTGDVRPRAQGGDNRSQHIEADAEKFLALVDAPPDMTVSGRKML